MPPKKRGSRASTASRKREESSVLVQAAEATTDDVTAEPVPSPATEMIEEAAPPAKDQQAEKEEDDITNPPSPTPTGAADVVVATPKSATPTSSNPQVPRDASLRGHHPTVSGVSISQPTSSSTRIIVTSLDAFLSSPECSGQLVGAWNRMGYCAATQAAILSNMSDSVISHVSDLVTQQVDAERVEAAKVEMLFDECLLLSQRLQEQVVTASLNEIFHSILSSSSSSPRTTSAAESEEFNSKTSKRKLVRLVGGVSSDEKTHGTPPTNNDVNVEIVCVQMPRFACSNATSGSASGAGCPSAMLSPKQAHASRPTSGDTLPPASIASTPSFAFLQLSHSKQIDILANERRRFSRLAEERVEHLRLIYCSKRLLDVPVRRQETLRAGYARALFEHSVGEDLRAQSSNSSMFFTPTGSPRVTINQVALTTPAVEHHNDIFHQQHIPEVVTAAARAVSRLRSLSVTARAYPFDHPLCATPSDEHNNSQPTTTTDTPSFIVNDKHCQAILAKGARQDLSMDRVSSEANAVMRTLTKYIRSMVDAMHTELSAIEALEKELGTAAPKTDRGVKVKAAIKEAMETFGVVTGSSSSAAEVAADEDGVTTIYDQQFDNSVLYHQFPECVARLYTIRLPAHALLEASAERERLQMIHYDSTFVKFAEAQHEVWGAYKLYFNATGDQAYASPPDYSDVLNNKGSASAAPPTSAIAEADTEENEWLERGTAHFGSCKSSDDPSTPIDFNSTLGGEKPVNKASSPISTPKTLSQQAQLEFETHRSSIARLMDATSKYTDALATVAARMAVLKEIEPLLKRRDYILHAQSNMQAGSKERLLSRSVNMAKQLREEESLRKMIQKEIPSITAQVVSLCDSWEALTRTRMIINNKDVLRVVSGMTKDANSTTTTSATNGSAAHGGGSTGDCGSPRPTQYIYGVEAAAAIGAASTTPGSRLGSPVPGGMKRDAASRSPAPQLPRRQMSSQIPSPSPQPKDRAATPIAVRNMSRVAAPSVSPRPRSVTPAKSPQAARVTLPPSSNGNGTATRNSRVAISTPTSAEARAPNQLSRGTSSVAAVSRSLAQPPSRALSRSKAVSPATTRAPPTTPGSTHPMQRGTATNPVQHPARSRSPQPKGSSFTRPPPMNNRSSPTTTTSASPRAGGASSSARVPPGSKRSRSLTPTTIRDGMAPSPLHPSSSVQPRSAAMSRSRQPLQDRQDANSQPTVSMPSTNKNPSVPATASSPISVASPSAYVPSVFALPTADTTTTNDAEE